MPNLVRLLSFFLVGALIGLVPAAVRAHAQSPVAAPTPVASAQPAELPVLNGFVGPGYDIALTDGRGDLRGRQLPAGTYRVRIHDYSTIHNFELKGDGVDVETEEEFVGQVTWTVTFLAGGEYEFECDPHHDFMYGEFTAVDAPAPPPPPPPPPPAEGGGTLIATVRPNYTIDLKHPNGTPVTQVAPGTYTIQVDDQASEHNFHLTGPGVDRATTVAGTGAQSWTVTLAPGNYTFVCDPHADGMRGTFTVASGPVPPPPPPAGPPPSAQPAKPGVLIATVRANYTIDLKLPNGAKADTLQAGAYAIEVRDQTKEHNFHLTGPGVARSTAVAWVGTTKWSVELKPGTYKFVCDPHAPLMKGSVTVTAGAPRALSVSGLSVRKVGRHIVVRVRVNKRVAARIRLLRRTRALATVTAPLKVGQNVKRLRVPARARRGLHRVQLVLTDAGKRKTLIRAIRL